MLRMVGETFLSVVVVVFVPLFFVEKLSLVSGIEGGSWTTTALKPTEQLDFNPNSVIWELNFEFFF